MLVTLATHQTYLVDRRAAYSERVELLEPDDEVPNEMNGVEVNGEPHPPPEPSYKRYALRICTWNYLILPLVRIPITTAKFSPDGKIIWAGTSHGFLLAFNSRTKDVNVSCTSAYLKLMPFTSYWAEKKSATLASSI
jgi:hypothetical protein